MSTSSVRGTKSKPSSRPAAAGGSTSAQEKGAAGIAALVQLAEMDMARDSGQRHSTEERAATRRALVARLSHELLEGYERALLAGREPPVVRLMQSACTGCHVRVPTILEQRIRFVRGVAVCPRCLRLVYNPDWLTT